MEYFSIIADIPQAFHRAIFLASIFNVQTMPLPVTHNDLLFEQMWTGIQRKHLRCYWNIIHINKYPMPSSILQSSTP